jgi:hypothetical protein
MSVYWCALVIPGVGDEDGIYAFCLGDPAQAPAGYKGVALLTDYPQNLSATLDPIKVEYDLSGFTFALAAEAPWLSIFARRIYLAEAALVTAVSASATTLDIAYAGAVLAGEFVFLGRETIKLGVVALNGSYVDAATGQVVTFTRFSSCVRGALGSVAEPHDVSEQDDNRVYAFPELSGRLCEFHERYEGEVGSAVLWRGLIDDIRLEDEDESLILVDTTDLLSILVGRKLNKEPYQGITTSDVATRVVDGSGSGWISFFSKATRSTQDAWRRYNKTGYRYSSFQRVAIQIAGALTSGLVQESESDGVLYYTTTDSRGQKSYTELGSAVTGDTEGSWLRTASGSPIYEPLCFGQDFVNVHGEYYGCGLSRTDRHHPLHILLLVMLSTGTTGSNHLTWDRLGASWGLAIPAYLVDVAGFEAEMVRTIGLKVDRLVLGWDGKDWTFRDLIDKVLRPLGYYLLFKGGRITIKRLSTIPVGSPSVPVISADRIIEMSESLERRMGSASQKIKADFGFPWGDQSTITLENRGKQARLWWPESDKVGADFDLTAFQAPDDFGKSAPSVYLAWVLQLMWRPIPIQRLKIAGRGSSDFWPGSALTILAPGVGLNSDGSSGVLVGKDGDRVDTAFTGLIVDSEYSPQDGCWTLGLWLQNEPLRGENVPAIPVAAPVISYDYKTGELVVQRMQLGVDLAPILIPGSQRFVLANSLLIPRAWNAPTDTFISIASSVAGVSSITLTFYEGFSGAGPELGDWLRTAPYDALNFGDKFRWLYGASDAPALGGFEQPKWYV